ncbi:MAG TPA: glycine zipper family protein, partial [Alcanivorax sp.]|nr:glycine zipper family protein [Alcanivorax sp.]
MHRIALITLAALLTTACASSKRVVVDKQGIDEAQYQQDLSDCRAGGAVIGGILGAIFGNSGTAGRMAGGGAVIGAAG